MSFVVLKVTSMLVCSEKKKGKWIQSYTQPRLSSSKEICITGASKRHRLSWAPEASGVHENLCLLQKKSLETGDVSCLTEWKLGVLRLNAASTPFKLNSGTQLKEANFSLRTEKHIKAVSVCVCVCVPVFSTSFRSRLYATRKATMAQSCLDKKKIDQTLQPLYCKKKKKK